MINLNENFIAKHELDIAWDRFPLECIVTYWHIVDGKNLGAIEFRSIYIAGEPTINTLLRALRKAYDHLNPEAKDG